MNLNPAYLIPGSNRPLGNKYTLLEQLGDGSHGVVWRAERCSDGAVVAVKIPKQPTKPEWKLAEGKELLNTPRHPNVIELYDMGKVPPEKECYAIEMEYFPSESLAQKLEERSHHFGNTYQRLFKIYDQVLQAVKHLANLEIPVSHGDIKPHNILVGQDDLVKLTDFGSSALPEEIYTRTRENGGTVLYSSPEFSDCVSRKGSFEELIKGDIYSLGVLLYQLTTGALPHDTQSAVRSHDPFSKPTEINSGICLELEQFILNCLEKDPGKRPESIDRLIDQFESAKARQVNFSRTFTIPKSGEACDDWSSAVVYNLEQGEYRKAAKLAETEFKKSGNEAALLQQLNALYRGNRLFDFLAVFEKETHLVESNSDDAATIRLLAIKVYLKRRNFDKARQLIEIAKKNTPDSFEVQMYDASVEGLSANFEMARQKLESLNKQYPMRPAILKKLLHVCEQMRDYESAASYLRVLMRQIQGDEELERRREQYIALGAW